MTTKRTLATWMAGALMACGGGSGPRETTPEPETSVETDLGAPGDEASAQEAPPVDGEETSADPGGAESDAGAAGEGEDDDAGAETEQIDPALAWRQMIQRGRQVFRRACDTCHPDGEDDLGPRILGVNWGVNRLRRQIRRGSGRMRPIPLRKISEEQMDDLMAFLTTLRTVRGVQRPQ